MTAVKSGPSTAIISQVKARGAQKIEVLVRVSVGGFGEVVIILAWPATRMGRVALPAGFIIGAEMVQEGVGH